MNCSVPGCLNKAFARSWCRKHYMRWWTYGDVSAVKQIKPDRGAVTGFVAYAISYAGDDCLIWPYSDNGEGYAVATVDGQRVLVSRIVCAETKGPAPSEVHHAAHGCGNGHLGCITPKHLRWATPKENSADILLHGNRARGERQGSCKLRESQVKEIFRRAKAGEIQHKLGDEFGISQTLVGLIKRGQRWSWLTQGATS